MQLKSRIAKLVSRDKVMHLGLVAVLVGLVWITGVKTNFFGLAATPNNSLQLPTAVTATLNTPFTVPLTLQSSGSAIDGVDVMVYFDPTYLKLSAIDATAPQTSSFKTFAPLTTANDFDAQRVVSYANQSGVIQFSALTYDAKQLTQTAAYQSTAPLVLANLTFVPLKAQTSNISFIFDPSRQSETTDANVVLQGTTPTDGLTSVVNLKVAFATTTENPTPTTGVLADPDFEATSLASWKNAGAVLSTTATNVKSGQQAAVLTGVDAYSSQDISGKLTPGVAYTFSGWVRVTAAGSSWGTPALRIGKYEDLGSTEYGEKKATGQIADNWQNLQVTRTFTEAELTQPVFIGVRNFGFTGVAAVDAFTVSAVGMASPVPTPSPIPTPMSIPTPTPVPTPTPRVSPTPVPTPVPTPLPTPRPTPTPTLVPSPSPVPTPTPSPVTKSIQITGSIANQDGGGLSTSGGNWFGTGKSTLSSFTGMRFTSVAIPRGAKIISATLEVESTLLQWLPVSVSLYGDNVGNSAAFTKSSVPSKRVATTSKVAHSSNIEWKAGQRYTIESVTPIVQAIINRSDWTSNNALSIILKGTGSAWSRKYIKVPRLVITYQ